MMEKCWLVFCPKDTFLGVDLISVTSAQSQNNAMAFPPTLHSLQPDISSTKFLSQNNYLLNLGLVKLFFHCRKPLPYIYFQLLPFYIKSAIGCQDPWVTGAIPPKHIPTSTGTDCRAVTFASKVLKDQGSQKNTRKTITFGSQISHPNCQYYARGWYCNILIAAMWINEMEVSTRNTDIEHEILS